MQMPLNRTGEHTDKNRSVGVNGDDLSHGCVRFLVPYDEMGAGCWSDSRLGVTDMGVRETLFIGALVVDPQIPPHEDILSSSRVGNGRAEAGIESGQRGIGEIWQNDVVMGTGQGRQESEARLSEATGRGEPHPCG
jgi:hypothetical protein